MACHIMGSEGFLVVWAHTLQVEVGWWAISSRVAEVRDLCGQSQETHACAWGCKLSRNWVMGEISYCMMTSSNGHIFHITGPFPSKNYWQFSSTILIQFSCNYRWDFQKCPCNSHLQFSSNSHQTILIQFSPTILIQFSPTILIQFSPDNSHPIFTWQFSSNFHLTILIQFSPTILTQFSSTLLSQFSPTMLSQFSRNDQPICSHQSCCYFYSMLIL